MCVLCVLSSLSVVKCPNVPNDIIQRVCYVFTRTWCYGCSRVHVTETFFLRLYPRASSCVFSSYFFFLFPYFHQIFVVLLVSMCSRTRYASIPLAWPFLMQSDLSVENGLFRLKPKSGFLMQSIKGFFDSTFFD